MSGRMRRGQLGLLAVCIACVAGPTATRAWRTAADTAEFDDGVPVRWQTPSVPILVYGTTSDRLPASYVVDATALAIGTWNAVPCGTANLQLAGPTNQAVAPNDGRNTIEILANGWRERGFDAGAVGTTDVAYQRGADGTWAIVEADVYLNDDTQTLAFADFGDEGKNVHAVLVHEIGHVLGSLHNCEADGVAAPTCDAAASEATMYPLYQGDAQLTLAADDVAGFCFLYGRVCATTADCARGDCVAGACVGCASTADCSGTATCDTSGRCVEPPPIEPPPVVGPGENGDPCAAAADCASDRCLAGSCAPACTEARGCMSGIECTATADGTMACALAEGAFGAACDVGAECQSRLCLLGAGAMSCTRACGPGDRCPSGTHCETVEAQRVCVLPPAPSGCTVAPRLAPRAPRGFFGLVFVAAVAYGFRRNRKRR